MVTLTEAKKLVRRWGRGTQSSRKANIEYHVRERGKRDLWRYLRKAHNFNKKGASARALPNSRIHYERKSGEFLIEHNGYIVTYGSNRRKNASR